jgi:AbrB family looped-hinge helix DNA binding protein
MVSITRRLVNRRHCTHHSDAEARSAQMREYVVTVTTNGRLTLPAAVRRQLGIEAGDRVSVVIEDNNGAKLRRIEHDITSVRGLIPAPPGLESQDFDELIDEAIADHSDERLGRFNRGRVVYKAE